ncbi:prepilin-type N-terminal cleavage/methylation domain-containing protein, partial [Endozoicomonas sp. SESOKO1]|uniref:prepilin-type N-terminal cleavage/methylation domain-containing protein n=1 Tax=Endozoicomonas sp. SESOKO1 TaxID=2828742 RepID=UPI002147DE67
MISPVRHHQSPGFTLLEIMLVLLLTGLMLSTVIPTLVPDSLSGQVNTLAEQLLATTRQQQQQAMLSGQDRGLKLFDDGYQFLQFRQGSWQPLGSE